MGFKDDDAGRSENERNRKERLGERREFLILLSGGAAIAGLSPLFGCQQPDLARFELEQQ